jgi:hypothetical protein
VKLLVLFALTVLALWALGIGLAGLVVDLAGCPECREWHGDGEVSP